MKFTQVSVSSVHDTEFRQGGPDVVALGEDGKVYFYSYQKSVFDKDAAWVPLQENIGQPSSPAAPQADAGKGKL